MPAVMLNRASLILNIFIRELLLRELLVADHPTVLVKLDGDEDALHETTQTAAEAGQTAAECYDQRALEPSLLGHFIVSFRCTIDRPD